MSELEMLPYFKTENVVDDLKIIIDIAQKRAYKMVNMTLVERNWLIGKRIAEEELLGQNRAEYGANVIKKLAKELTEEYGKGFTKTNLYNFYDFYKNSLTFSTHCVENHNCYLGLITESCFKSMMKLLETGMKKKPMIKCGAYVHFKGIFLHNIIIVF